MSILADMTWQHQVLLGIVVLSCVVSCIMVSQGRFKRDWRTGVAFTLWNAVEFYLLVAGADPWVWQYTFYAAYLVIDEWAVLRSAARNAHYEFPEGKENAFHFMSIVWMMFILALIGTGATA